MIQLSIMSAETKRIESAFYAEERRIQEEKEKAERPIRVEKLAETIFILVREKIKNEKFNSCFTYLNYNKVGSRNNNEIAEACEIVSAMLKKAGYKTNVYEYSQAWQTRKGEFGYFYASW